jgi:hypothetical protein
MKPLSRRMTPIPARKGARAQFVVEIDVDHETTPDWLAAALEGVADSIRYEGCACDFTLHNANGFVIGEVFFV